MRSYRAKLSFLLTISCLTVYIHGQGSAVPKNLFGKRIETDCTSEIYFPKRYNCFVVEYSKNFLVEVYQEDEGVTRQIRLLPKEDSSESDGVMSLSEKKRFLEKVAHLRPIGPFRLAGPYITFVKSVPRFGEIYENAFVESIYRRFDGKQNQLTNLNVYFPFDITGRVEKTRSETLGSDRGGKINFVYINGCSYLTLETSIVIGTLSTLKVFGPLNQINRKCEDLTLPIDPPNKLTERTESRYTVT